MNSKKPRHIKEQCDSCTKTVVFVSTLLICYDLFIAFLVFCCARGLSPGRGVVVGAKCYFCCKPYCNNNNMRNVMKVELTTVARPPASPGWRLQKWRRVEQRLLGVAVPEKARLLRYVCYRWMKGTILHYNTETKMREREREFAVVLTPCFTGQ